MHFTQPNLNHKVVKPPATPDGLYEILFDDDPTPYYVDIIDLHGIYIAQRLRNAGMPSDLMYDLEKFITNYTNRELIQSEEGY